MIAFRMNINISGSGVGNTWLLQVTSINFYEAYDMEVVDGIACMVVALGRTHYS